MAEEQLGLIGDDVYDNRDRLKNPADGRVSEVNLLSQYPLSRRNQGRTNRCGAFSGTSGMSILMQMLTGSGEPLSANDLYWWARGDRSIDGGVFMRDLMKAMAEHGACPAMHWPDDADPLKRPAGLDNDIPHFRYQIKGYERIKTGADGVEAMLRTLSIEKLPIFVGVNMYRNVSANACRHGMFEMPEEGDMPTGGHAMLVVGWRWISGRRWFILLNSWGPGQGDGGVFYMPEQYVQDGICRDAWTLPATNF